MLVSCDPKNRERIQEIGVKYNMAADPIGQTAPENFVIRLDGKAVVSVPLSHLKDAWERALERALQVETGELMTS